MPTDNKPTRPNDIRYYPRLQDYCNLAIIRHIQKSARLAVILSKFPHHAPFRQHLATIIGDTALADRYTEEVEVKPKGILDEPLMDRWADEASNWFETASSDDLLRLTIKEPK